MSFGQYAEYVTLMLAGLLVGGVMFCRLIPKVLTGKDVCELGEDGNPGSANAFVHCGVRIGSVCLLCDLLKGFLPVFIALQTLPIDNLLFSFVMVAPVLGHALGIFNGFSGGKCIATSFGVVVASFSITWIGLLLAFLYIFIVVAFKIDHRKGSIAVFAAFGVSALVVGVFIDVFYTGVGFALISVVAVIKHLVNR